MTSLSIIVSLVMLLLSYVTLTAPLPSLRATFERLPPTSPSDLQPLGATSTAWNPQLKTLPKISPTFSSHKSRPERFPTLSLSETDTHHRVIAYRGHHCRFNPIFHIAGLPRAVSTFPISTDSGSVAENAGRAAGMYGGVSGGKSSGCISFDYHGIGAGSVELLREGLWTPRTAVAMWNNERCEGQADNWATIKRDKERRCIHSGEGQWRSMRVWYGSERLADEQLGTGTISVQEKTREQMAQKPTEDIMIRVKEALGSALGREGNRAA